MPREQKTSFNLRSVSVANYGSAYMHQKPEHRATLGYIHHERTHLNERWDKELQANGRPKTLKNYLNDTKKIVKEKTKRAMQKRAEDKVISEAAVVIDEQTSMDDLKHLAKEMEQRFGWTCVQIHMHRDEGFLGTRRQEMKHREGKYNLHAHMFFITTNLETGKSWKWSRQDGSTMQDITAQALNLTRGERKGRESATQETVDVLDFKANEAENRLSELNQITRQQQEKLDFMNQACLAVGAKIDEYEQKLARSAKSYQEAEKLEERINTLQKEENALQGKLEGLKRENENLQKANQEVTKHSKKEWETIVWQNTTVQKGGWLTRDKEVVNWEAVAREVHQKNHDSATYKLAYKLAEKDWTERQRDDALKLNAYYKSEYEALKEVIKEVFDDYFNQFWEDCKRQFRDTMETLRLAMGMCILGKEYQDGNKTYRADEKRPKLLINGETIEERAQRKEEEKVLKKRGLRR